MHSKGENSMAMSGPSFRNTLVGTGWAISLILCIGDPRKHSPSPCRAPISGSEGYSKSGGAVAGRVVTIVSSLNKMGGCSLSHKHAENGCKCTCLKFGGRKPDTTGDVERLMHARARSDFQRKNNLVMG